MRSLATQYAELEDERNRIEARLIQIQKHLADSEEGKHNKFFICFHKTNIFHGMKKCLFYPKNSKTSIEIYPS